MQPHRTLVVLDAGHGTVEPNGLVDPGVISPHGLKESDLALDISKQLESLLKERGYIVIRSRRHAATSLSVLERPILANLVQADALISIHFDGHRQQLRVGGTSTLYADAQSRRLAEEVHRRLLGRLHLHDRSVQQRPELAVLRYARMPSIIVEPAYLSQNDEEALLARPAVRHEIALAIRDGLDAFIENKRPSAT